VLDVGCGCGRVALPLSAYLSDDGSYAGFDADASCIDWCRKHIELGDLRFTFVHLDVCSESYNPQGRIPAEDVIFPYPDQSFQSILVSSVFTHMRESGIGRYISEIARVLDRAGGVLISTLLMNNATRDAMRDETTLFRFDHRLGSWSWTTDAAAPTEAVSLAEQSFTELLAGHGLQVEHIEGIFRWWWNELQV